MNVFLEHLKEELTSQGLTQKELAEKTNISVNTIRGWFSKNLVPDVFNAVKIAAALHTTVEYLVTGKDASDEPRKKAADLARQILEALNA